MFKLEGFSGDLLETTKAEWLNQAEKLDDIGLLLTGDIHRTFDGVESYLKTEDHYHAYFLIEDGSDHGCAILDIVQARPKSYGSWLKLLNITLEPNIDPDAKPIESKKDITRLVLILANSLSLAVRLTDSDDFSVGKIKIYGRTEIMSSFFNSLLGSGNLDEKINPLGLAARREGRWLVIEKV